MNLRVLPWSRLCMAAATVCTLLLPALAQARTLAEIKAGGVLRIGDEASYVPFAFRQGDKIVGYDIDVAARFCKDLHVKCELVDTVWAGIIPALFADKFDMIMGQLDYSSGRMSKVAFSIPYVEASQAMLVRAADKDKITSLDDMSGRVLGVKLGSPGALMENEISAQIAKDRGKPPSAIKTFDDHPAAYLALEDGRVDGVLNSYTTLAVLTKQHPGVFAIVPHIGKPNWAGIAVKPKDKDLVAFLDQELTAMTADGSLAALQKKWFGVAMQLPNTIPPQ
jgi:polar amino acid transport system substrate-binding protein